MAQALGPFSPPVYEFIYLMYLCLTINLICLYTWSNRKIFIGGLAKDTTLGSDFFREIFLPLFCYIEYPIKTNSEWENKSADTFVKYFGKYGEITDSVIMKDRHTGRPRGFGFITYADPSVVDTVIAENHIINGKQVRFARYYRLWLSFCLVLWSWQSLLLM